MLILGLTGGIGSGKSTVASFFNKIGVPVYIADDAARELLNSSNTVQDAVRNLLGTQAFIETATGLQADRKFIASKVFNDAALLSALNKIIHPAVRLHFNNWLQKQQAYYVIYEAAILLESGGSEICDYIALVTASQESRISRVMKRDKVTRKEVELRIMNQWSDKQRLKYVDFVIINEDFSKVELQINRIHAIMLK